MVKNEYQLEYLPSFNKELEEIMYYITYILENPKASKRLLKNIRKNIFDRLKNRENYEKYKINQNSQYIWYRIYIKNYTIFYTVKNNKMQIAHIFYKKRNLKNLL